MIEGRSPGRKAFDTGLAVVAALLAIFATTRAREATLVTAAAFVEANLDTVRAMRSPLGSNGFWIGGWVGPRADDLSPGSWRAHAEARLDVSMGPLEDRFRRADNVARLALLDSLRATEEESSLPFVFVRDDSLHPDETTRPGWEARVEGVVRAYRDAQSLAGYFLADEPQPSAAPVWAPAARLLRELDPHHTVYVNFLPIAVEDAADPNAAARWRAEVSAAVAAGELTLFTFDAYPFGPAGERPHFLATLREAARVSQATGRPFGAVLQWTGHGDLRAVTEVEALYQATQALAHGASGITWFTYVTPNPSEEPWRWRGGAIAYDGTRTARYDTLAAINARIYNLAMQRGTAAMRAAHFGGGLPDGFGGESRQSVPGVEDVRGGPATLGYTAPVEGKILYLLANRDRTQARTFTVNFTSKDPFDPRRVVTLGPGDAVVFTAKWVSRLWPPGPGTAPDPRTPNQSDKR